jgi:hypothetical protein
MTDEHRCGALRESARTRKIALFNGGRRERNILRLKMDCLEKPR